MVNVVARTHYNVSQDFQEKEVAFKITHTHTHTERYIYNIIFYSPKNIIENHLI